VVAVDTNVLVYAEITSSSHHMAARECLRGLAEGPAPWAIAWPCVYEFLRVVTHPRVYHPPVPLETARADLASILASPSLVLLAETGRHAEVLDAVLAESRATGNLIHDAHIVALCREHGVREIVTGDADFRRFSGLTVTDPFTTRPRRRR
jgi:toxin-antitoxin system PIN domain toxin